jgi:predicted permease
MLERLQSFFRGAFRRSRFEREMDDELRFHIEARTEDLVRSGISPRDAVRRAHLQFGGLEVLKESCRESRGLALVDESARNLRYAIRSFRRSPGFTAIAVISLALAIGGNSAMFTLIDALLLKPLPVREADRLVVFMAPNHPEQAGIYTYSDYIQLRDQTTMLSDVVAQIYSPKSMRWEDADEPAGSWFVSGNYFPALGVQPLLGRTLSPEDDRSPGSSVAVLAYEFWRQRFHEDRSVIGKTVFLNRQPLTVIGVLPRAFQGTQTGMPFHFVAPASMLPAITGAIISGPRAPAQFRLLGRLRPSVRAAQAEAELTAIFQRIHRNSPGWNSGANQRLKLSDRIVLLSGRQGLPSWTRQSLATPLLILTGLFGVILLIACTNVANLMMARATARKREISVRLAIGAGKAQLIRQMLTEGLLLAITGAVLGILFDLWVCDQILKWLPAAVGDWPLALSVAPDWPVAGFTIAVAIATGILFGTAPVRDAMRSDVSAVLKDEAAAVAGSRRAISVRKLLIIAQVGMSVLLLVAAGLFIRTLLNLTRVDTGIDRAHGIVVTFGTRDLARYAPRRREQIYQTILKQVDSIPGVRSAAVALAPGWDGMWRPATVAEQEGTGAGEQRMIRYNLVSSRYFETMGIPIVRGGTWQAHDDSRPAQVAVVNQALERMFFANQDAIGRHVRVNGVEFQIIGVAADARYSNLRVPEPALYGTSGAEGQWVHWAMYVRTYGNPTPLVTAVRQSVERAGGDPFASQVVTLAQYTARLTTQEHLFAWLSSTVGLMAALLTAIGLFGVLAYSVARRTREIGILMALGAARGRICWLITREGLVLVLLGIAAGIPSAMVLSRLAGSLLFGVSPLDGLTLAAAAILMFTVAIIATVVPARRAMRVDPIVALRCD